MNSSTPFPSLAGVVLLHFNLTFFLMSSEPLLAGSVSSAFQRVRSQDIHASNEEDEKDEDTTDLPTSTSPLRKRSMSNVVEAVRDVGISRLLCWLLLLLVCTIGFKATLQSAQTRDSQYDATVPIKVNYNKDGGVFLLGDGLLSHACLRHALITKLEANVSAAALFGYTNLGIEDDTIASIKARLPPIVNAINRHNRETPLPRLATPTLIFLLWDSEVGHLLTTPAFQPLNETFRLERIEQYRRDLKEVLQRLFRTGATVIGLGGPLGGSSKASPPSSSSSRLSSSSSHLSSSSSSSPYFPFSSSTSTSSPSSISSGGSYVEGGDAYDALVEDFVKTNKQICRELNVNYVNIRKAIFVSKSPEGAADEAASKGSSSFIEVEKGRTYLNEIGTSILADLMAERILHWIHNNMT